MTKVRLVLFLATAAVLLGSSPGARALGNHPEWCDEQESKNPAERTICSTKSLWVLDDNLNLSYQEALQAVGGQRGRLQASQREWVRVTRNGCGSDVQCLTAVYNRRLSVLDGIARSGHV